MARKHDLTWFAARDCWKKKHGGKVYYLGPRGVKKGDRTAYQAALEAWAKIEADLNGPERKREQMRAEIRAAGREPSESHLALDHFVTMAEQEYLRKTAAGTGGGGGGGGTLGTHAAAFLNFYGTQAKLGHRSINRATSLRYYLGRLLTWRQAEGGPVARDRPATDLNAMFVASYYDHLAKLVADHQIAASNAASTWAAFKQFVGWLWERDAIALPRNIKSRALSFVVPAKNIDTLEVGAMRDLLAVAPDRATLFALLAMNIGATGRDIADLAPDQINWKAGTITRKRSKTAKHAAVPTVTYTLWPETLRLLRILKSHDRDRLLTTDDGTPLIRQQIRPDGKLARVDNVRLAWRRLRQKALAIEARNAEKEGRRPTPPIRASFTTLRKTSATLLNSHPEHRAVVQLWLGHAPRGIAERHYAAPSQERLDGAIAWLGGQYGLATGTPGPIAKG